MSRDLALLNSESKQMQFPEDFHPETVVSLLFFLCDECFVLPFLTALECLFRKRSSLGKLIVSGHHDMITGLHFQLLSQLTAVELRKGSVGGIVISQVFFLIGYGNLEMILFRLFYIQFRSASGRKSYLFASGIRIDRTTPRRRNSSDTVTNSYPSLARASMAWSAPCTLVGYRS